MHVIHCLHVRFRRVHDVYFNPFWRYFHRFYPFFAIISLSFAYFPFFIHSGRSIFSFSLACISCSFFPILDVFPRFRPFLVFFSFLRYAFVQKYKLRLTIRVSCRREWTRSTTFARFRRIHDVYPVFAIFSSFYPFFASISFRFDYFLFFLDTWSISFFDYFASFLVFVLLPILNPFPRFRSFFFFLSFVRHFFRNMSYATRKRLYSWARLFVCNYKLHQTLIFYQKKGIPWQKTSSNLGLVWPDSLVLFFGTVNWQINTLVRRFLSHFCGLDGRTLVFYQKMVYRDRKRHLTWVWCTLITWFEKMIP